MPENRPYRLFASFCRSFIIFEILPLIEPAVLRIPLQLTFQLLLFDVNFSLTFFGYTLLFLGISILPHFFQLPTALKLVRKTELQIER